MKTKTTLLRIANKWIVFPIITLALIMGSCEKDVIELQPFNQISEVVAFSTPEKVELSVIGMYQAAQVGFFNEGYRGYPFGAAFVQQGDNRGEDVVNVFAFYAFTYQGTYSPTTANNVFYWSDTYRLINRINIVAEGVQTAANNGVITQEKADEYKAEALLMRAAAYHELLIFFARPYNHSAGATHWGVPYHKTPFTNLVAIDEGFATGRHSVNECYQWMLEDLNFAELHLPLKSDRSGNFKVSRATKGAAAAYKARVYQHMWDMAGVITEASKFTTGGVYAGHYALGADPWTVFANNYTSDEYLFGMENSATNYPSVNGALASQYKRRFLVCHSPINWRNPFWLDDDLRRDPVEMTFITAGRVHTNKYRDDVGYTDLSPMMRYAEVLLNLSEAYARRNNAGDFDLALGLLNQVRDRALADPATQSYTAASFATNILLLEAILNERRIELAMEGRRWPDIHRLQHCPHFPIDGIPAKIANGSPAAELFDLTLGPYTGPYAIAAIPYSDHRFVWPIPQNEINSNPTLAEQQNPGW